MGSRDLRELVLVLGLGLPSTEQRKSSEPAAAVKPHDLGEISECPSLTLSLFGETVYKTDQTVTAEVYGEESAVSSFSNASVKREREMRSEEVETERVSSRISDDDENGSNGRKKLRLTKNQSALLEESFKHHSTLNPKQKQDLARELNLRPRQVEVWFQNRRARTKLKQTELDCEFLKKWCETLTEENRWLQKELQELKAMKFSHPLYKQIPSATLTMCPACERIGGGGSGRGDKAAKRIFTNPSPAC